jgi:hypothetical protein
MVFKDPCLDQINTVLAIQHLEWRGGGEYIMGGILPVACVFVAIFK